MSNFDPAELRDEQGRWTAEGTFRSMVGGRMKVQTPTQFRHPGTGHTMGKSEIGDTFEALFARKGARLLESRYGQRYLPIAGVPGQGRAGGRSSRTSALDFRLGDKFAGELKTLNIDARSQKTAIKKAEVERKLAEANRLGLNPLLIVQVVDMRTRRIEVFAYEGFSSKAVSKMERIGSYDFTASDFRRAQEATGHWAQRHARAARSA